ncbi:MAG: DnaJ domain-containing protein [Anaerolineales bacterium]|nr:DnaJ domain-containing protein [Anaerolineales bacterium]
MRPVHEDLYRIMEIEPSANSEQIKTAYRKLAKRYHPDLNPSPTAKLRMQEINRAYEVLGDPIKRARYDRWRGLASGYRTSYTSTRASYYSRYQRSQTPPRWEWEQSPPPQNPRRQRPPPHSNTQHQTPPRPRTAQRRSPFGQTLGTPGGCSSWLIWLLIHAIINGISGSILRSRPSVEDRLKHVEPTRVSARATATAQNVFINVEQVGSQWPLLVFDSFDENMNNWPVGEFGDERWTGYGSLSDGKYRWDVIAHEDFIWCFYPDHQLVKDFYLTVRAQIPNDPMSTEIGLIFRKLGRNYYVFSIRDDQRFRFLLYFDNEWTTLIPWTRVPVIMRGEENKLTVVAEGTHFRFFINDHYVGEAENTKLRAGRSGVAIVLHSGGAKVVFKFDNFELRRPDNPTDGAHHPNETPGATQTPTPMFMPTMKLQPPYFTELKCLRYEFCG